MSSNAIARVLLLTDAQTHVLHDPGAHRRGGHRHDGHRATSGTGQRVAPVPIMTSEALPADVPALILDHRTTVLEWNRCAAALLGVFGQVRGRERNLARLVHIGADGWLWTRCPCRTDRTQSLLIHRPLDGAEQLFRAVGCITGALAGHPPLPWF